MKQHKPVECHHRITSFQAHSGCPKLAAICEKECQQLHESSNEVIFSSVDLIEEDFKLIKDRCKAETRPHVDRIYQSFLQINRQLQKEQTDFLKYMEKDLNAEFFRCISLDKELEEKIYNKRYERIKCNELFNFINSKNIEQGLLFSNLPAIIQKYSQIASDFKSLISQAPSLLSKAKSTLLVPNPLRTQSALLQGKKREQNKGFQVVDSESSSKSGALDKVRNQAHKCEKQRVDIRYDNTIKGLQQKIKDLEKSNKSLNLQLEKNKYENRVLAVDKNNLMRQLAKLRQNQRPKGKKNLAFKTWNIIKVVTKKIKKSQKAISEAGLEEQMVKHHRPQHKRISHDMIQQRQIVPNIPQINKATQHIHLNMDIEESDNNKNLIQPLPQQITYFHPENIIHLSHQPNKISRQLEEKPIPSKEKNSSQRQVSIEGPLAILDVGTQKRSSESDQQQLDIFTFFKKKLF